MFYVVRKGQPLEDYHASFRFLGMAQDYAENLKATLGHNYDVLSVETRWTTQTLADLKAQGAF